MPQVCVCNRANSWLITACLVTACCLIYTVFSCENAQVEVWVLIAPEPLQIKAIIVSRTISQHRCHLNLKSTSLGPRTGYDLLLPCTRPVPSAAGSATHLCSTCWRSVLLSAEAITLRATSTSGPFDNFRTATVSLLNQPQQQCSTAGITPVSSTPAADPGSTPAGDSAPGGTFVSTEPLPSTPGGNGSVIATTVQKPVTVAAQPLPPTPEEQALLEQIAAANGAGDITISVMNNGRMSGVPQVLVPAAAGSSAGGMHSGLVMSLLGCIALLLLH